MSSPVSPVRITKDLRIIAPPDAPPLTGSQLLELGKKLLERGCIAIALEAPRKEVTDPVGRQFRVFAEQTKSDLTALAACIRGSRQTLPREAAQSIRAPTLIAVGTKDSVAGSAQALAAIIPAAQAVDIPGRDHMLAVGDKVFKAAVLDFLQRRP